MMPRPAVLLAAPSQTSTSFQDVTNSFRLTILVDPHPLNLVGSTSYKNIGGTGRVYLPHLATFHHFLPTAFPSPFKHLRTLPFCVGHKSFVCHSYENTGGMEVFFPIWFPRGASPHEYAVYSAVEEIPR
jgi:hypothetical protein